MIILLFLAALTANADTIIEIRADVSECCSMWMGCMGDTTYPSNERAEQALQDEVFRARGCTQIGATKYHQREVAGYNANLCFITTAVAEFSCQSGNKNDGFGWNIQENECNRERTCPTDDCPGS